MMIKPPSHQTPTIQKTEDNDKEYLKETTETSCKPINYNHMNQYRDWFPLYIAVERPDGARYKKKGPHIVVMSPYPGSHIETREGEPKKYNHKLHRYILAGNPTVSSGSTVTALSIVLLYCAAVTVVLDGTVFFFPTVDKVRTRWRSIKDRFNSDVRAEGQVRSGSASRTRTRYRHYHALQFLRPVLATRSTWSSTLQPGPGAVLPRTSSDPSQPSDSQEAPCRSATHTAGDQEAGPSGVPLSQVSATGYAGTTRQRQRALDRNVLPKFMHLSEAFNSSLKSLSYRVESGFALMERGFNHFEHRFNSVEQRLDRLEADLNRPAHHFFSKIEKGMAEHLSPEQQLNVLQACNNAFLQAMQHNRYGQQSVVSFPPVPPLTRFTSLPTCAAYHCTDTSIQSQDTHRYTTTSLSAAGHFTDTTMASATPVWSTTATPMHAWSSATTRQTWNSPAATTTCSSPATTIPQTWTITAATSPPARTSTANQEQQQQPPQQQQQPPQQQPPQQQPPQQQPPQQQQQPPQDWFPLYIAVERPDGARYKKKGPHIVVMSPYPGSHIETREGEPKKYNHKVHRDLFPLYIAVERPDGDRYKKKGYLPTGSGEMSPFSRR
ncbi:uncharacterized protein [Dendrobates tinctorius]|uniref:uncharacterized protein n=1 Tax=Dendrobates tinctorius TaxID=92724 RepID=UPI003CC9F7F9